MTLLIPVFLIILFMSGSPYVIFYTMWAVGAVLVLFVLAMIVVPDESLKDQAPPNQAYTEKTTAETTEQQDSE